MCWIGSCYLYGYGVKERRHEGGRVVGKSVRVRARRSDLPARACYEDGLGVEKNKVKALELYLKAAELGEKGAAYQLGFIYH